MDEDRFNMELRKFLKHVGVTSQREIERVVREHAGATAREGAGRTRMLRVKMALTSPDAPGLNHVVEAEIPLE
ncbi:hypothetical protein GXW74_05615 [Roseomonas eburnea]|uniref:Uncharacterized protein n=1 Tax=Neoroseomonas eburnea TaxID=1346889 RepID=A0A9X9X8B9_9PROT|nr:DUF6494 family protein [Neoroseomonas eburnea]MBR0679955.1 hypothetical protein [Neoroseomonas eburnea]